jgi:hypothetical protein
MQVAPLRTLAVAEGGQLEPLMPLLDFRILF